MKRFLIYLAGLTLSGTAGVQGAEPFEGELPIELARYFTGGGGLYTGLPDDFPDFDVPEGLRIMGSLDQTTRQEVVFSSTLDGESARRALEQALMAQGGWVRLLDTRVAARRETGFVVASAGNGTAPARAAGPVTLCHVQYGNVTVDGNYLDRGPYLRRTGFAGERQADYCRRENERRREVAGRFRADDGLRQSLPTLEVTGEVRPQVSGPGGTFDGVQTSIRLSDPGQGIEPLHQDLARQLREQGWAREVRWTGDLGTGSNWTAPADDGRLVGMLTIRRLPGPALEAEFRLAEVED